MLQRIGLCFGATALLAIDTRPRTQAILAAALLLGDALLLQVGGALAPWVDIASRFDFAVFGGHVYAIDPASGRGHDPEGLLSTLPSMVNCLLGLLAGRWLRARQIRQLLLGGAVIVLLGWAWSFWQPWNKNVWTPSFALWTSGWAMFAIVLRHALVDVRGWPALGRRFGMNAIAAYALSDLLVFLLVGTGWMAPLYTRVFERPLTPLLGPWNASLSFAIACVVGVLAGGAGAGPAPHLPQALRASGTLGKKKARQCRAFSWSHATAAYSSVWNSTPITRGSLMNAVRLLKSMPPVITCLSVRLRTYRAISRLP